MFCNGGMEDVVHESLECGWRVAEAKVHYCWFEEPSPGLERCLVFVSFLDADIVISLADVEFGEYHGSTKVANEVSDEQKRVLVTNRPGINFL
jgi:hypothetical protein